MGRAVSIEKGVLYVVATPIGNLGDLSYRARSVLDGVDLIAAEDTRHTRPLLQHYSIQTPLIAVHEHNEHRVLDGLVERLSGGASFAMVSDAGTPLISDPGFPLVRRCREVGIPVSPIPGPCAAIAALSAAGLPTDRFSFEGFPARSTDGRRIQFEGLCSERRTLVFYESSHRIESSLRDMKAVFGGGRRAVIARELTKMHETLLSDTLAGLTAVVADDPNQRRGEFVIIVAGNAPDPQQVAPEVEKVLRLLVEELPLKQAAALTARITGEKKNALYRLALSWQDQ